MSFLALGVAVLLFSAVVWFVVTQPVISRPDSRNPVAVDAARLETHVRMLSEAFVPRDYKHPEVLDRAATYIRKEFEQASEALSEQPYEMEGKTYRNVIAALGPDTSERIVIGAHYDAFGEFPGADDNASGVAGLIELAYLLSGTSLPMRVELVAFTLEEPKTLEGPGLFRSPYAGSAVHADSLKKQGVPVRIMLALEMIGFFRDAENSQSYPNPVLRFFYPSRGNYILIVGRLGEGWAARRVKKAMQAASPLATYSINAPASIEGIDWSDHFNYWKVGYPAVMITDTAPNRNKNYHTAQDTPERLDYKRMALVVQGVYSAVLASMQ
ncbi:MAG: peptidase M28 [Acidobacteria bacterium RIFCSPLOWO2_02_FULL_61_28]|nr:MAG: peptidase M28 [Acidobacteria bacterium RIFCSPLOWO2_02_FULL_61_28]